MQIRAYTSYHPDEVLDLYASVGWTNYVNDPEMLRRAFENSLCTLAAYDGERLAGVVRAVGDGASVVFMQDLLVHPEYRRQGVGTALFRAVLDRFPGAYQLELLTDRREETIGFYRALGLRPAEELGCMAFVRMRGMD